MLPPNVVALDSLEIDERTYRSAWRALQPKAELLITREGLGSALRWLAAQPSTPGNTAASLPSRCLRLPAPGRSPPHFWLQVNPHRASRPQPPAVADGTCFVQLRDDLDPERVRLTSRGTQLGIDLVLRNGRRRRIAWAQRFPLVPGHTVIASADDSETQDLQPCGAADRVNVTLQDLAELASRLGPDWLTYFNGAGAGATQKRWHVQALPRHPSFSPLPLELAGSSGPGSGRDRAPWVEGYPIAALALKGRPAAVTSAAASWIRRWIRDDEPGDGRSLSLIASAAPGEHRFDKVCLWIVPRHASLPRPPQFGTTFGCLEMMGLVVLSASSDIAGAAAGAVSYDTVASALRALQPSDVYERLERRTV